MKTIAMLVLCALGAGCGGRSPSPSTDCAYHSSCSTCAGDTHCFWCGATDTCKPLSGSCSSGVALVPSECGGSSGGARCSTSDECGCGNWCDFNGYCASGGPASERWCCADSDCPTGYLCSGCGCLPLETCSTSADCSLTQYCGSSSHVCRCSTSGDCGYNEICSGGLCRWSNSGC